LSAAMMIAPATPALAQESVTMAVTDVAGLEELRRDWGPFVETLEQYSDLEIEFASVTSRTAAVELLRSERVDFVLTGPAEYVVMRELTGAEPVLGFSRPSRVADQALHRKLSLAASGRDCVEVAYWSVRSGEAERRWISPRAFGFDGLRWHVRALCHREDVFKDFVVGRFQAVGRPKPCPQGNRVDAAWLEWETLCFEPSRELSANQRKALEMDYGLQDGRLELTVRRAMRIYTLRRLGFVGEPLEPPMRNELGQLEWVTG